MRKSCGGQAMICDFFFPKCLRIVYLTTIPCRVLTLLTCMISRKTLIDVSHSYYSHEGGGHYLRSNQVSYSQGTVLRVDVFLSPDTRERNDHHYRCSPLSDHTGWSLHGCSLSDHLHRLRRRDCECERKRGQIFTFPPQPLCRVKP